jgi:hypothetical protein
MNHRERLPSETETRPNLHVAAWIRRGHHISIRFEDGCHFIPSNLTAQLWVGDPIDPCPPTAARRISKGEKDQLRDRSEHANGGIRNPLCMEKVTRGVHDYAEREWGPLHRLDLPPSEEFADISNSSRKTLSVLLFQQLTDTP